MSTTISILHPSGASININQKIFSHYLKTLIPLVAAEGDDDGNYATTAASDLACLQDKEGLMALLTFESVEEAIKKRVEKKAMVFGQDVTRLNLHWFLISMGSG